MTERQTGPERPENAACPGIKETSGKSGIREMLLNMRLEVNRGKNRFTMSHGSFNYRRRMGVWRKLKPAGCAETAGGFALLFDDGGKTFALSVSEAPAGYDVRLIAPRGTGRNLFRVAFPTAEGLHYYGCGEIHSAFDLKGRKIRIFVAEHQNALRIGDKIVREKLLGKKPDLSIPFRFYESYYVQPTFTTSGKWCFHADTKAYAEFDFRKSGEVSFETQEKDAVFHLRTADTCSGLSEELTALTGRQKRLPDWIYDGAILAVQGGTETVDLKIDRAQGAGAKVAGIWSQDWCGCRRTGFGYQVMWNWQWDRDLYPDLDRRIKEWKARGIRFLGYINPFLALEGSLYRYASARGWCVKDRKGQDYLVKITTFPAAMVDLTNPDAYEWYKGVIQDNMIALGMGGWMADFGEYLPTDCVLFSGEDPELLHNRWPAIWAGLNRKAIEEAGVSDEVFFFTRAGYTDTCKESPMMWTGDQHVDWSMDDGLPSVIKATLSLAMSGYGITHSDVGGYTTVMDMTRSKELLLRWEEMNAFSPLFRSHEGNQPSRNAQFDDDEELLAQLALTSRVHAALKPYLRELEAENSERGVPVMRPLFYHYEENRAYAECTEYLLGRDILVAPIIREGASSRIVWLPDDEWVHFFTKEEYGGGSHDVEAPVGRPPVFVRKGAERFDELTSIV